MILRIRAVRVNLQGQGHVLPLDVAHLRAHYTKAIAFFIDNHDLGDTDLLINPSALFKVTSNPYNVNAWSTHNYDATSVNHSPKKTT